MTKKKEYLNTEHYERKVSSIRAIVDEHIADTMEHFREGDVNVKWLLQQTFGAIVVAYCVLRYKEVLLFVSGTYVVGVAITKEDGEVVGSYSLYP